ncbi:MAG: hypothetical protein COZ06_17895 [Armatimonadetes bacterium CG_4_10_14_3_um_filter_66_18]|nr:hypothetical protein [Armatimonadota bacterium]OIP11110.1 MAG: hypothetical protein AUJ96_02910 [Armatimonadetes bacterium CG2_30_66_41]PIU88555.1 MAG: hypothetical protein COS65_30260 [Armatimonadetes bacterium CG06_land_8_20_14_3_00_66_21]PIW13026.1 MAG: hypothetical protein COW34_11920 [Armatimonadetes bacterium CG17_big_fil_post_rev_8_21_14_2_50_66_6]PIX37872.1 MAG: hypothetical protein COZ57_32040 [Armatimonadetes bacterium CG_4_8_14_3_um_filter_66_20]PIY47175.1 MAG: hypothetical prote
MRRRLRAFTLIEPLVVIALTAILPGRAAAQAPDLASVQREIEALKQKLRDYDGLKARLAALEEQLKAAGQSAKAPSAPATGAAAQPKLDGYLQLRANVDRTAGNNEDFSVRRLRLNMRGKADERTSYRAEVQLESRLAGAGPGSKLQLRTLYVDRSLGEGRLRMGQAKVPWGYELEVSSADLWSGERSLFMDRLFPSQRDIGLQYQWRLAKDGPLAGIGLFNGAGINAADDNAHKDLLGRVRFPWPSGSASLSYYDGQTGVGAAAQDRSRVGLGALHDWGRFSLVTEYVTGHDRGAKVAGAYAQLGYRPPSTSDMVFVKPDWYDENRGQTGDAFRRMTVGYSRDLSAATRLTLAYEFRDASANFSDLAIWDGDAGWVQWLLKY